MDAAYMTKTGTPTIKVCFLFLLKIKYAIIKINRIIIPRKEMFEIIERLSKFLIIKMIPKVRIR
jgi:hypothetical protein